MEELYSASYYPGENYNVNKSFSEQNLIEHAHYMQKLVTEGKLLLAGPFKNNERALLILRVGDINEAHEIIRKDPAIIKQIFSYELNIWNVMFSNINKNLINESRKNKQ